MKRMAVHFLVIAVLIVTFQNCSKVGTSGIAIEDATGAHSQAAGGLKKINQSLTIYDTNKIDVLFVIDNSKSMAYEQQSMASRVRNFLDVFQGLDWQIAVTTTDPDNVALGDGRLIPLSNDQLTYVLDSTVPSANAQTILGNTLQRSEFGSGTEQGIRAVYRAIERSLDVNSPAAKFIRPDAQLAVVLISDEDESADGLRNDPYSLISFINQTYSGSKGFSFHSIISRPGDYLCLDGAGKTQGVRYSKMSKLTGGILGDVCASDYAEQATGIAQGVKNTLKSVTLSCVPVVDAENPLTIIKDGQQFIQPYVLKGVNMEFTDKLPAGHYSLSYSCLK